MHCIDFHRVVWLLLVIGRSHLVHGQQRISQEKCREYRDWTSSHGIDCTRPLLSEDHTRAENHPHRIRLGWKSAEMPSSDNKPTYQYHTSGSLISDRYVLTVAHSPRNLPNPPEVARLGEVDHEIDVIIHHPQFNRRTVGNDVALVRLREPVSFSQYIRPACLWDSLEMNFTSVKTTVFVANSISDDSRKLQDFDLDIWNGTAIEAANKGIRPVRVMDNQLYLVADDMDICQGESGSPAHVTLDPNDCMSYIVGIHSYRSTCHDGHHPGIYTRVASFIDWIEANVWP